MAETQKTLEVYLYTCEECGKAIRMTWNDKLRLYDLISGCRHYRKGSGLIPAHGTILTILETGEKVMVDRSPSGREGK